MEDISQGVSTNGGNFKQEENYWINKMQGELDKALFPYDYLTPASYRYESKQISFNIVGDTYNRLINMCNNSDMRLQMILTAIVALLLHKYTGNEDIILGSPIYKQDFEGEFYNTVLALRNKVVGDMSFKELLIQVKETIIEADENQNYPISKLLYHLGIPYDKGAFPLFDVAVLLENVHEKKYLENIITNVTFVFSRSDTCIKGTLEYNSVLYTLQSAEKLAERFLRLVSTICGNIDALISEISIISYQETERILNQFNNNEFIPFPQNKTIHELFEERARDIPNHAALVFQDTVLTYKELSNKVNMLAGKLREKGVKRGDVTAILVDRSIEMVIGIISILRAGGAYLPIDPNYPCERIEYILKDSNASVLLSHNNYASNISVPINIINLDDRDLYSGKSITIDNINMPNDIAYIIYTSGSTGQPKGVMIEHANVINTLCGLQDLYPLYEGDSYLLKTSYTFDVSVTELFGWFVGKGKLVILEKGGEKYPKNILDAIDKYNITHINFVPSMLGAFVSSIRSEDVKVLDKIRYIFAAGEVISSNIVNKFYNLTGKVRLENLYGPTEATIYAAYYSIMREEEGANIPIGKPIQNNKIYIMDKYNKLQPSGIMGQLCISGSGVARGYLNRPELTNEKFIVNPFVPGERLYKTGDLAKWRDDGNIEFLGRIDHQVKVRGFRIELGEIESLLRDNKSIKDTVVTMKDIQEGKYLCAYYVSDKSMTVNDLREYMSTKLPEYMIPEYFIPLDKIPLTDSGKIDRKSLPEPGEISNAGTEYTEPSNKLEEELLAIWRDILNVENIGVNHSFFSMGGNSIRLIMLHEQINKIYPDTILVADLFTYPTVRKLVQYIQGMRVDNKNIHISSIRLSDEYFINNHEHNDNCELSFSIDGTLFEKIKFVSNSKGIIIKDILLAGYIYLFYEISDQQTIEVQTAVKAEEVFPLKIDFSEIEDIYTLIQNISSKRDLLEKTPGYSISSINSIISDKGLSSIIPLFLEYGTVRNSTEFWDFYDIIMEFRQEPDRAYFRYTHNRKLRDEKMKELIGNYVEVLRAIIDKLENM